MSGNVIWKGIKVNGSAFRLYCYEDSMYDPDHTLDGFLKSESLVWVRSLLIPIFWTHYCDSKGIFIHLHCFKTCDGSLRAADLSSNESDEHARIYKSSRGNAALAGINRVTSIMLAYCVAKVSVALMLKLRMTNISPAALRIVLNEALHQGKYRAS